MGTVYLGTRHKRAVGQQNNSGKIVPPSESVFPPFCLGCRIAQVEKSQLQVKRMRKPSSEDWEKLHIH